MTDALQYADRDHMALGDYFVRHVSAMTAEGLHSKSDIAAELAWRDAEITRLRAALAAPPVAPGWQPIETAPDDMGEYLFRVNGIAVQGFKDATGIMCVQNERHEWRKMRGKPIYWMPLPAAPGAPDAQPKGMP